MLNIESCLSLLSRAEEIKKELKDECADRGDIIKKLTYVWSDMLDMMADIESAYLEEVEMNQKMFSRTVRQAKYFVAMKNEGIFKRRFKAKIRGIEKLINSYRF